MILYLNILQRVVVYVALYIHIHKNNNLLPLNHNICISKIILFFRTVCFVHNMFFFKPVFHSVNYIGTMPRFVAE